MRGAKFASSPVKTNASLDSGAASSGAELNHTSPRPCQGSERSTAFRAVARFLAVGPTMPRRQPKKSVEPVGSAARITASSEASSSASAAGVSRAEPYHALRLTHHRGDRDTRARSAPTCGRSAARRGLGVLRDTRARSAPACGRSVARGRLGVLRDTRARSAPACGRSVARGRLLDDHVCVDAAEAERVDRGAAYRPPVSHGSRGHRSSEPGPRPAPDAGRRSAASAAARRGAPPAPP